MADPFEVRMRFTNLLTHLSASTTSSLKTAAFALKHRDMDEDLHSCIIENLERGPPGTISNPAQTDPKPAPVQSAALMNNRANIMYFLEQLCEMAQRENHEAYVEFVRRDLGKIVDCVAASGANVKVVRRVVGSLGEKGVLSEEVVRKVEEDLKGKEREREKGLLLLGVDEGKVDVEMVGALDEGKKGAESVGGTVGSGPRSGGKVNGVSKADKRAIEQRIEEDRERNKRLRESVWAVSGDDETELEKMWEEGSDLNEDDYVIGLEEAEERRQFARYHQSLLQR